MTYHWVTSDCSMPQSCSLHGPAGPGKVCVPWCHLVLVAPWLLLSWLPALQTTAALPFGTIVVILVLWALVTIPLCIFGGIVGKNNR